MAKGGSRAFSGPAPDPNALRRDRDGADWTILPASGRKGDTPDWPLSAPAYPGPYKRDDDDAKAMVEEWETRRAEREGELWAHQWTRPQAIEWERNGQEEEVALYVRSLVDAEETGATTASRTLVKQLMETLGLSLPGMARLRWKIEAVAPATGAAARPAPASGSARDRLKLVDGVG